MSQQTFVAPKKVALSRTALAWAVLALQIDAVLAQPFSEAQTSPTGYANGTLAPVQACGDLGRLELREVIRLTAEAVPAAEGVPAFCRVDGTIEPEITFQVNLPMTWNG